MESQHEASIIKNELNNLQSSLSEKEKRVQLLSNQLEIANFDRAKLEKTCDNLRRKVKQME